MGGGEGEAEGIDSWVDGVFQTVGRTYPCRDSSRDKQQLDRAPWTTGASTTDCRHSTD